MTLTEIKKKLDKYTKVMNVEIGHYGDDDNDVLVNICDSDGNYKDSLEYLIGVTDKQAKAAANRIAASLVVDVVTSC